MTPSQYKQSILIYWKEKEPKKYKELKQAGTLDREAQELADLMFNKEQELTNQLAEKDQGQAGMIAREIVMHDFLPS